MEIADKSSQPDLETSVWRQSLNGRWLMNFNNKLQTIEELPKTSFDSANKRPLSVGSLVMTPKGIGRLLKIDEMNARVKFLKNEEEENFERSTVSNDFHVYLKILNADSSSWYRITVPSNGTTEMIKKAIEELKMVDMDAYNYVLIYQGKELADNLFFDQLDFKPNSKILMSGCKMYPFKLAK